MSARTLIATSVSVLVVSGSVFAADALTASEQAIILFAKSCFSFAGQKNELRAWAEEQKMRPAPPDMAAKLMGKLPGTAFPVTTPTGLLVIGSQDDAGCTLFVQHADGKTLASKFEEIVVGAKFTFKVTDDHDNPQNSALHFRGYEVSGEHRKWRVAFSSMQPGRSTWEAMMTAYNLDMASP